MHWQTPDSAQIALLDAALAQRGRAYTPYSRFAVGAALWLFDGSIITGCNVENASYGLTICAERAAVQRAVAEGKLAMLMECGGQPGALISAVAVVGDLPQPLSPCGACRQVLAEFAGPDCAVHCANTSGEVSSFKLADLLPQVFSFRS
jgi:pyrimidine-nucleoside phosphorylase